MTLPMEVSPQDVKRRAEAGEKLHLIDVREPHEYALARIEGGELIPMRNVPAELQTLEARADESTLIVYCHHGVRSLERGELAPQPGPGGMPEHGRRYRCVEPDRRSVSAALLT